MSAIRTMDFDALAAAAPLNRDASVVRDGSGETYDKRHPSFAQIARWDVAPALRKPCGSVGIQALQYGLHAGQRLGRVVILGVLDEPNATKHTKPKWVYRCDCNAFEGMRRKSILSSGEGMMCTVCRETERLRALASRPSTTASREADARRLAKMVKGASR